MQIKPSVGLAVGPADAMHWGQVFVSPHAYGIVEIYDPQGRAQQLGIQALSYLGERLNGEIVSLRAVSDIVAGVAEVGIQTIIVLVPVGRIVYIVLRGSGTVYIKRTNELASLMQGDGSMSGEVKEGDIFLLSSHGFSQLLAHDELMHIFDHLGPSEVAEKLTILLHEKIGGEGSTALVFGVTSISESEPILEKEQENITSDNEIDVYKNSGIYASKHFHYARFAIQNIVKKIRHARSFLRSPKKRIVLATTCLLSIFILSVLLGIWKLASAKKDQQIVAAVAEAQRELDEGIAILELNPIKGRERLTYARQTLTPVLSRVSSRSKQGRDVAFLYRQITDNLIQAMHIVSAKASLYYDMNLIKKGGTADDFALSGNILAISDSSTQTVYRMDIVYKNTRIVGGAESAKGILSIAIHGDTLYTLAQDGITKFQETEQKSSVVIKNNGSWSQPVSLVSYGGNLYILDAGKSRIWKYVATEKAFSDIREYLNPDTLPDLSRAINIAIDGSVWLGTTTGKILRFTQGKETTFLPVGVDPGFGAKLFVYTSDEVKNVYVLDAQNSRVVVLDHDGIYVAQYRFDAALAPSRMVVSEAQKKILFIAGGKIYSINLE